MPVLVELEKKNVRLMTGCKVTGVFVSGAGGKVSVDNGKTSISTRFLLPDLENLMFPGELMKQG